MDRNYRPRRCAAQGGKSLSARRAWIEISASCSNSAAVPSLSARRAWIEIALLVYLALIRYVALRKESVDRNNIVLASSRACITTSLSARRAWIEIPRAYRRRFRPFPSLSARRAWIEIFCKRCQKTSFGGRSPQGERG